MPIYEYECSECGTRTEAIQRLDDEPLTECRSCGGPLVKLMSAPAFQFKGSGWYVTDYADKNKKSPSKAKSEGSTDTKSGSGASESKTSETSSPSKSSDSSGDSGSASSS